MPPSQKERYEHFGLREPEIITPWFRNKTMWGKVASRDKSLSWRGLK